MVRRNREWWLLALGFTLLVLSQNRWGLGALAWLAPVPLLAALRLRPGWKFRLAFSGLFLGAWTIAAMKIITPPVPAIFGVAYGVPLALVHLPAYFLWDALVKQRRDGLALLSFAAATALTEWMQAELTPLGIWGSSGATQVGSLAVLQVLALVGMPGLAFWMGVVSAGLEGVGAKTLPRGAGLALAATTVLVLAWGALRSVAPLTDPEVRTALIRTDATVGGLPVPDAERRARDGRTLFDRTTAAAQAGARLVVWPEVGNIILTPEEAPLVEEASQTARRLGLELVIAYIMPVSTEPLRYENRARWFAPDGSERISYLKHHPVPGEPAIPGEAPAPTVQTSFGPATLALCYDFDFPALARVHARAGAGLVAIPSSDWRGIDPIHTEMAALRAIEGGYSLARSTRFGLSGGVDLHGRLRGQQSTNESLEPFLMVSLPTVQHPTLATTLGNGVLAPLAAILTWAALVLLGVRLRGPRFEGPAHA